MRRSWLRLFWLIVVLVGALAGYLVSSGLGTRLLHQEIETQLTRLLDGPVEIAEVDVRWEAGLRIEARDVSAYPSPIPDEPAALRARRVVAWIDLLALVVGRLDLSTLTLEGPHLRVVQNLDGSFVGLPFPPVASYPDEGLDERSASERLFTRLGGLDLTAEAFADGFRVADRIEVIDGTLSWQGGSSIAPDGETLTLRVELVDGIAERDWLSEAISMSWNGVFVDGRHAPFPFSVGVERKEGQPFAWSLSLEQIPLDAAETPLAFIEGLQGLGGRLDAHFLLETISEGRHRLTVDGKIDNARIELRRSKTVLEQDRADLHAKIVFDPYRVRLTTSRLAGKRLDVEVKAVVQRPIRSGSPTRIESRVRGIQLEDLRDYAQSLESESEAALTVSRLTERVVSGQIKYIEASGNSLLGRWQDLFSGRVVELPDGFVLGGAFDEVTVESGPDDRIENLEGEIEWVEDQIVLRNGNAIFRGEALPQMNAVINGVSNLVSTSEGARRITKSPPSLPGLGPLFQALKPRDPNALPAIKAVGLAIDHLEHPLFRWPLRNLGVLIEPLRKGVEITVREGTWGGAPVSGEVIWFNDPVAPSVSATLTLAPPAEREVASESLGAEAAAPGGNGSSEGGSALEGPEASDEVRTGPANRWAAGRLEMEFRPRPRLPFQSGRGYFRFEGADLLGDELEVQVEGQGTISTRMKIGLESPDSFGFDVTFALTEGRLEKIAPFVVLPADLATGSIGATGSLSGRVRPGQSFIAELDGRVRAEAGNGRVHTNLPLLFRLAKATEGYNPFAKEDELEYETMSGSFAIARGLLSVSDFEIEGPLRVYARADIDTNVRPSTIRAVVGIFLFRKSTQILENLPLVRSFLPGSDRGLIGTYFDVEGAISSPDVEALPMQTLMSGVPSAIKAPFKALRFLFDRSRDET